MKISFALGAEMTSLVANLSASLNAAAAALPPLPAMKDLVTLAPDGDLFGGEVKVTITAGAALEAYCAALQRQLAAFAQKTE